MQAPAFVAAHRGRRCRHSLRAHSQVSPPVARAALMVYGCMPRQGGEDSSVVRDSEDVVESLRLKCRR